MSQESDHSPRTPPRPTKQPRVSCETTQIPLIGEIDEWGEREERVYVIKMGYYYYVGKSNHPKRRLEDHQNGKGAEFTKLHKNEHMELEAPLTAIYGDVAAWERSETLSRMNKHGVDYVRGSTFAQVNLSQQQRDDIEIGIRDMSSSCYICGKQDHLQKDCLNS